MILDSKGGGNVDRCEGLGKREGATFRDKGWSVFTMGREWGYWLLWVDSGALSL